MVSSDREGSYLWWLLALVGAGLAATARGVLYASQHHDAIMPAAIGGTVAAAVVGLAIVGRFRFKAGVSDTSLPPSMHANMSLSSLPPEWRAPVWDASDERGRLEDGFEVIVGAVGDWLLVEKAQDLRSGIRPFKARFPLAAVTDVRAGPPVVDMISSTVHFELATGVDIRFDVQGGRGQSKRVAQRFAAAIDGARGGAPPGAAVLEITSS
jgi:hypothetical protein